MLDYYAERLNAVELNGSFYRLPTAATLQGWAARVPASFRFSFKAPRGLTYSAAAFPKADLAAAAGLRLRNADKRLGLVLVQWPPTQPANPGLLDMVLGALSLRAAVEFRHESWYSDAVYAVLRRHQAALVRTDDAQWPAPPPGRDDGPVGYHRLRGDYTPAELGRRRRELRAEARARDAVHVYFKHEVEAPGRAQFMLD